MKTRHSATARFPCSGDQRGEKVTHLFVKVRSLAGVLSTASVREAIGTRGRLLSLFSECTAAEAVAAAVVKAVGEVVEKEQCGRFMACLACFLLLQDGQHRRK